jgi:hypothetical protein
MYTRPVLVALLALAASSLACGASSDSSSPDDGTTSEALGVYDRQTVYDEVKSHAHAPRDFLGANVTDAKLVDAMGWFMDQSPPAFYISAIRSDHHNDGAKAHAGGHCLDMYAEDAGQAKRIVQLMNQNPYVVEIGLGGAYKSYRSAITDKLYFNDNNATHVHIGVVHDFGR